MVDSAKYVPWYRRAEPVLGGLVPSGMTDESIESLVSQTDWLIIPTPGESGRKDAVQRGDPNVYFSLDDEIDLGLVCNTLKSIRKMRNILTGFHSDEKVEFLRLLNQLDGGFETTVGKKIYEHHWRQSPNYESVLRFPSNTMTENDFAKVFICADEIHQEGIGLRTRQGKYRRLLPSVSLARTSFPVDTSIFVRKLEVLRPLYELSLSIKSDAQIRKETAKIPGGQRVRCPKCGYGPIPELIARSCPRCHTRMVPGLQM
jgi:hypothetical protein